MNTENRIPESEISLEEQIQSVIKEIPKLKNFVIIGRRGVPSPSRYFCSVAFEHPADIASAVLNLFVGAPQLFEPFAVAVHKYLEIKRTKGFI